MGGKTSMGGHTPSGVDLLFASARIGGLEIRNRFVFQPHFTALGSDDGMPSVRHAACHEERARGGVGLIIFESQAIHPSGKMANRFVHAWDPAVVPGYREITSRVHTHGARIFGQLAHGGHTSLLKPPSILWAPSQTPEPLSFHTTKAIDPADIRAIIDGFARAAVHAREGGFDGVEIKVAHDGLLRSFASPFFNRRTDGYGGSFENRMRLSVEVLAAIKRALGDDFPVGVRICLHEFTPWGYGLDYGLEMARHLEETGLVDYFNSDAGSFSSFWMEIPPMAIPQGSFRELNARLRAASRLPAIAFGRIKKPELAADIIARGEADLIGMGRQLIADPETPNKVRSGRASEIRYCIACNDACVFQVNQDKPIRCIHNPDAGNESAFTIRTMPPANPRKRIAVVGGGPAGLKVAETAARRGHTVTLFERTGELGGQVLLAMRQPHHVEIGEVTKHLEARTSAPRRRCSIPRRRRRRWRARRIARRCRHCDRFRAQSADRSKARGESLRRECARQCPRPSRRL
jgi:2,4-dienoyl-CoA reductase-like NADH-dependent reductase (Old Yellow Enzyme family)